MCNEYEVPGAPQVAQYFDIEIPDGVGWRTGMAPLSTGPIVLPGQRLLLGQWGMIPPGSSTRIPTIQPRKTDPPGTKPKRMSTNNARMERIATAPTYRGAWKAGQRCLIPATAYIEPYWGLNDKNIFWRFARADGQPWALAGLWSEWTDHATGEVVPNFTMITQNCDAHPLLKLMHKPERDREGRILPADQQDKRTVVPIEKGDWDMWLNGSNAEAESLIQLPALELFKHGPRDPNRRVTLDLETGEGIEQAGQGGLF